MKYELAVYPLILVTGVLASAQPRPAATLIVTNATIYTVDKQHPKADAVAAIGMKPSGPNRSFRPKSWLTR